MRSIVAASSLKTHGSRAPEGNLFASIQYTTRSLQSWKVAFPHPSASPACYAGALLVKCPLTVAAADVEEWDWISTFTFVEHLEEIPPEWALTGRQFSLPHFTDSSRRRVSPPKIFPHSMFAVLTIAGLSAWSNDGL